MLHQLMPALAWISDNRNENVMRAGLICHPNLI